MVWFELGLGWGFMVCFVDEFWSGTIWLKGGEMDGDMDGDMDGVFVWGGLEWSPRVDCGTGKSTMIIRKMLKSSHLNYGKLFLGHSSFAVFWGVSGIGLVFFLRTPVQTPILPPPPLLLRGFSMAC